jgi:glycosyltransferase involved in cell wall biosynthesis
LELTVVVPAFNEGGSIFENLREIADTLTSFSASWEIILVDDGSRDETYAQAMKAQAYIPGLRVLSYPMNRGKGYALRHGACAALGELVVFLDADLELHPKQIPVLLQALHGEGVDLVVGSKSYTDSGHAFPLFRRILSRLYSLLVQLLFHLPARNTQVGLKLFRRKVLCDALPAVRCTGFAFDLDLLVQAHRMGFRLAEAPVEARFLRTSSRLAMRDVVRIWVDTVSLRLRARVRQRSLFLPNGTSSRVDPKP